MTSSSRALADRLRERMQTDSSTSAIERIFEQEPVDLTTFVTDKKFLGNPPLSIVQFNAVRHTEQIYFPEIYPAMVEAFGEYWEPVRFVNFLTLQWGKGSGKDHICRILVARAIYLLLCMRSPQDYYGMPEQDTIHAMNVAASAPQAHGAFFKPLKRMAQKCPCFRDVADPKEFSIEFDKQLEAISGHSFMETQEGMNPIVGVADEISAFKTKEEAERYARVSGREPAKTATGILDMLTTSAETRFPRCFKIARISYPRFRGDAIQQLTARARADVKERGDKSVHYVDGPRATWEVNPRITGKADLQHAYDEDPIMAEAKYECNPTAATNLRFRNEQAVYASFLEEKDDPVTIDYYWGRSDLPLESEESSAPDEVAGWQIRFGFSKDLIPIRGAQYCIHGDMAITQDRAGIAMAHVKTQKPGQWTVFRNGEESEDVIQDTRPLVQLDFVTSFEADLHAIPRPREVQIRWYRKLIWELISRGFNIRVATFDRFQSTDTMQILSSRGIDSHRVSTDTNNDAWDTLQDVMYDGRLIGYYRERLVKELLNLRRLPNGRVDHAIGGSKDEADALAGAVLDAVQTGGEEGASRERADLMMASDLFVQPHSPFGTLSTGHEDEGHAVSTADISWSGEIP